MTDSSFKAFIEDQLQGMSSLRFRRMFGGYGLYQGDLFFGLIADGQLYFKTDETTRERYLEQGMTPFDYETKDGVRTLKHYYAVPAEVIEDPEMLVAWAWQAIEVAARG